MKVKSKYDAFDPFGKIRVLNLDSGIIAFQRIKSRKKIVVLNNISDSNKSVNLKGKWVDIITNKKFTNTINLSQYDFVWLVKR